MGQAKEKKSAVRLSSSFYAVARRRAAGDDLTTNIALVEGRAGAVIQRATIEAWAAAGLVTVKTRKPIPGEHHLARPIIGVKLTREGARRVRAREKRELARAGAAA
jgi:hypothetical protein